MSTASIQQTTTPAESAAGPGAPRRLDLVGKLPSGPRPVVAGLPRTVSDDLGVPTVHHTVIDYANFDHGATTPALVAVAEAAQQVQRRYGSVHRGAGYASRVTTGWFEAARAQVGQFVGARDGDQVVFTRNTTDALRLLAHCLPRRTRVIAWESAHHAALLPWPARTTTRLPVPDSADDAVALLREALQDSPARHQLVVLTGACNVTGEVWPIAELVAVAKEFGARTVLDAAQYAPHRELDLEELGVDWVAFSGHKLYAPYGAGVLAGRSDWLDAAGPYLPAGGATAAVTPRHTHWQTGPARHEGGTPNAVGAIAIAAACATLRAHRATIEAHEEQLHGRLRAGLAAIDGVRVIEALGNRPNVGVVTFTVEGYEPSLVSQVLADEQAIAVRDGRFCAHLLSDAIVGHGQTAIRASIGLATTSEHVDRLIAAVRRLVEDGPQLSYVHTDAGWSAPADPRDLSEPLPW
ncbi:aminotransferase class V-fold PLP-dependent enzyme [Flexivirga meconopsidis]|uniref:aminotransferase class V-fold PLP-dependent enzyme n=1 Tax=Flexivirga meconopsidis TaxID=2977121 RepID=UPI00223FD7FA|nr:aminotransferase class V-fold PLP-dependent enzyme [Flexivirga meconopsidis]